MKADLRRQLTWKSSDYLCVLTSIVRYRGSSSTYPGGIIVSRSIALGKPAIYVSINYRLSGIKLCHVDYVTLNHEIDPALGFLASKEVKAAGLGNFGLQDRQLFLRNVTRCPSYMFFIERQAFRWVQKYISAFGGDPTKVTMYASTTFAFKS